jgi:hypothetical protein
MASRAYAGPAPSDQGHISADRLFAELDQRHIMGDLDGSTIEVISIHVTQDAGAWVQMEVAGEVKQSVLLHLRHSTTVDQAIAALNAWGQTARERRPRCIDVAPQVVRTEWASDPRRI